MDCGLMYLNLDVIDSMNMKEEPVAHVSNLSSNGSLVSLDSPRSAVMEKRMLDLEDTFRPEKKQRLGRKTKNSGLRAERNRQSAAASRERSKRHLQELERLSETLPDANVRIGREIQRISQSSETSRKLRAENVLLQAKLELEYARFEGMTRRITEEKRKAVNWLI